MLLANKKAVIYGAAGAIGSAVARAFAKEGATVFLAGRTLETLNAIKQEIVAAGGEAYASRVDAFNELEVEQHLQQIVNQHGRIDISYNVVGLGDAQGAPLIQMTQDHFLLPIENAMRTHFITSTVAARHMTKQRSGVILALTAHVSRTPYPEAGGFGIACAAIEALCRQLAVELGPSGIRVITLRSAGSPDTPGVVEAMKVHARNAGITVEQQEVINAEKSMLKRMPKLAEVADVAVLMASDRAGVITAAATNVTCGAFVD